MQMKLFYNKGIWFQKKNHEMSLLPFYSSALGAQATEQ